MSTSRAPAGLGPSGRAYWHALVARYEFEPHEVWPVVQVCRTADLCDRLYRQVSALSDLADPDAVRLVSELRQQWLAAARQRAALRLPDAQAGRPQRRQLRGVYGGHTA